MSSNAMNGRGSIRAFLLIVISTISCSKLEVTQSDLIGTWRATPESARYLTDPRELEKCKLTLLPNHKFVLDIPSGADSIPGGGDPDLVSGRGNWECAPDDRGRISNFCLTLMPLAGKRRLVMLIEVKIESRNLIFVPIGDPDVDFRFEFEREK